MTAIGDTGRIPRSMASRAAILDASSTGTSIRVVLLLIAGSLLLLAAIFSRVMNEEIGHDEQLYVGVGALMDQFALYRQISYGHLPNLPIALNLVIGDGPGYHFLAARLLVFGCWIATLFALAATSWLLSRSVAITSLAVLLLTTNPLFIERSGALVATHLFPVCFAIFGFMFFVLAMQSDRWRALFMFGCGLSLAVAAGFKANYAVVIPPFVVSALLLPLHLKAGQRLLHMVVPLAVGGLIGGTPTLYFLLASPDAMLFDTVEYFTGPHRLYWGAPENAGGVEGLSLPSRLLYGYRIWGAGATVVIVVGILYGVAMLASSSSLREARQRLGGYPVLLAASLSVLGVLISFAVAPAFPQYYMPPIPFAILLVVALLAALDGRERLQAQPGIVALALGTLLLGAPQLMQDLPKIASPAAWTGLKVHKTATHLRAVALQGSEVVPRVATLTPIYAIEAGLDVYPELASGPFYYRVGDYLTAEQRQAYGITSPLTIGRLLEKDPPQAVLVGQEGVLDVPLERFAMDNGYRRIPEPLGRNRYGESVLFLRPAVMGDAPAEQTAPQE